MVKPNSTLRLIETERMLWPLVLIGQLIRTEEQFVPPPLRPLARPITTRLTSNSGRISGTSLWWNQTSTIGSRAEKLEGVWSNGETEVWSAGWWTIWPVNVATLRPIRFKWRCMIHGARTAPVLTCTIPTPGDGWRPTITLRTRQQVLYLDFHV